MDPGHPRGVPRPAPLLEERTMPTRSSRAAGCAVSCLIMLGSAAANAAPPMVPGVSGSTIPIGAIIDHTGFGQSICRPIEAGDTLALRRINASGGVNGRTIRFVTEDDGYSAGNAGDGGPFGNGPTDGDPPGEGLRRVLGSWRAVGNGERYPPCLRPSRPTIHLHARFARMGCPGCGTRRSDQPSRCVAGGHWAAGLV